MEDSVLHRQKKIFHLPVRKGEKYIYERKGKKKDVNKPSVRRWEILKI